MSLGDDKYKSGRAVDARLEALGATRSVPFAFSDVEVEGLDISVMPWMERVFSSLGSDISASGSGVPGGGSGVASLREWLAVKVQARMDAALKGAGGSGEAMVTIVCSPKLDECEHAFVSFCSIPQSCIVMASLVFSPYQA